MNDTEKYKELYETARAIAEEEQSRANRLDEKAARFLAVVTILIGIFGGLSKHIIKFSLPPKGVLEWSILVAYALLFFSLVFAWFLILIGLCFSKRQKIPLNDALLSSFVNNDLRDIYYTLAIRLKDLHQFNRKRVERKLKALAWGYGGLVVSMVVLTLFSVLLATHQWKHDSKDAGGARQGKEKIAMGEKNGDNDGKGPEQGKVEAAPQAETDAPQEVSELPQPETIVENAADIESVITRTGDGRGQAMEKTGGKGGDD